MKTYFLKNIITNEETEKIKVNTLYAAQQYFDVMHSDKNYMWMLMEEA